MDGARAVIGTLVGSGVEVCFSNPGTSEAHLVTALDKVPGMRGVLCLFEGVATGAADGYGRMADGPAATLLHLGAGLANGLANLHNARRAATPVVNLIGDHAVDHKRLDPPLESDIDALARTVSGWTRRSLSAANAGADAAAAVAAALRPPGQVATLIIPADVSWSPGGVPARAAPRPSHGAVPDDVIASAARALTSGERCALLLGGPATHGQALRTAGRIAGATGARLLCETFPARLERGIAGVPDPERLAYFAERAAAQLAGMQHLVLVGARSPVAAFASPGLASDPVPADCQAHALGTAADDLENALADLAERTAGAAGPGGGQPAEAPRAWSSSPTGPLTTRTMAAVVGMLLPEGAIVSDEANTSGVFLADATRGAPRHDWLTLTGGAIGQGMPLAAGAAIARPDRPVICLEGDGSAMYNFAALWTQARERLDVTTIVLNNRSYAIVDIEMQRLGLDSTGPATRGLLDLSRPEVDFTALATGMGVPAARVTTAEELTTQLQRALAEPGPHLIDAVLAV